MLLLRTEQLAQGSSWLYEIEYDGFTALAIKSGGKVSLKSRNNNDFTARYATSRRGTAFHAGRDGPRRRSSSA
jgi:ATP-dependent DNA ligase